MAATAPKPVNKKMGLLPITVDIINFKEGTQPNPLAQFDKEIEKVVN